MKKALTIYIDDDTELKQYLATFVVYRGEESSVTMQNGVIPEGTNALYLPWKNKTREAMFFREIGETGSCNECKVRKSCKVGEMVRYNCPFFVK